MNKEYEIKTLNDVLRAVTLDNRANFLKDFENFLTIWTTTRSLIENVAPDTLEPTINSIEFKWIDDGKHDAQVNVEVV